ncbi:PREDICTED: lysozyme C, milk isozyme-like [Thamnophis sirtalis]|uniref:lysozyme n=1 Tax=Thamnophis sirtalis TaxID=35019 RepID=A0A6I9YE22_9SAUR|nr:PREDICTED: lysozyme C, milk isozyme-like [Thamnophis sirtalis]
MKTLVLTLLFFLVVASEAKRLSQCELASLLKQQGMAGFAGVSLENWVCMVAHESSFDTQAMNRKNKNRSVDYGIFQINSHYWCNDNRGHSHNTCNKPCSDFLNDDIIDDIACAKRVVSDPKGMNAWEGWKNNCRGRDLSRWTQGCNL